MLIFIRNTYYHHGSFMVIHGFHGASQMSPKVAAVTKIQSVHRATQIRIIYHEVVAAVRWAWEGTAMVRNVLIIVNNTS